MRVAGLGWDAAQLIDDADCWCLRRMNFYSFLWWNTYVESIFKNTYIIAYRHQSFSWQWWLLLRWLYLSPHLLFVGTCEKNQKTEKSRKEKGKIKKQNKIDQKNITAQMNPCNPKTSRIERGDQETQNSQTQMHLCSCRIRCIMKKEPVQ